MIAQAAADYKALKARAHSEMAKAIYRGLLPLPAACEDCGGTDKKVERHHEDYTKPLDVVFVCRKCHKKRHRDPTLTGSRWGLLVILHSYYEKQNGRYLPFADCLCDCGKHVTVSTYSLKKGVTKSCGCLQRAASSMSIRTRMPWLLCDGAPLFDAPDLFLDWCDVKFVFKSYGDILRHTKTRSGECVPYEFAMESFAAP